MMNEFDTAPIDVFHHGALNPVTGYHESTQECTVYKGGMKGQIATVSLHDGMAVRATVVSAEAYSSDAYLLIETPSQELAMMASVAGRPKPETKYYVKSTPFKRNSDGLLR